MNKDIQLNSSAESDKLMTESKSKGRAFWSKTLADLQRLGKSLMFPIAILPFAALLNRFGQLSIDLSGATAENGNFAFWFGFIIQKPGAIAFDNIALFFAIGTAFGLAKDNRGEAALVGAVLYIALTAMLMEGGLPALIYGNVLTFDSMVQKESVVNGEIVKEWVEGGKSFSELFYVQTMTLDANGNKIITGGTYILNIGVLGGLVAGCMSAYVYNKFKDTKLPMSLSFFGGRRFVPMMVMALAIPLSFAFAIIWPWFQYGLVKFGTLISSGDAWAIPGAFLYALINRIVQPFGLHHIINTFLWFQMPIENFLVNTDGKVVLSPENFPVENVSVGSEEFLVAIRNIVQEAGWVGLDQSQITADNWSNWFVWDPTKISGSNGTIIGNASNGKVTVFGDINSFQRGLVSGTFQTGYFPMYWGGLTAAAAAMVVAAPKENRKQVISFLGGVAIVAALTGIDEPIVFSFIFVGPILWAYNAIFTATFAAIAIAMHMHIGFGFSGGFIDYVISFMNSWGMSKFEGMANGGVYGVLSNPLWMLALAAAMAPLYYFSFYFTIIKMDIQTPGREQDGGSSVPPTDMSTGSTDKPSDDKPSKKVDKYGTMASKIIAVVGLDNFQIIEHCSTRLRLTVKDNKIGTDSEYKQIGAYGVKRLGDQGLQLIIGTDVEHLFNEVKRQTGK
ncbi:PTS transporter subunit EIIC [Spiroplasma endosymbiont of Othius punctulatus]|uniref:PTS transporter subunit EIIC n=1 Tax=Spiroplasma endosymbiont of Othius punctulatus TaxID=3066289 RepID=UPI0030D4B7B6